MCIFLTVMDGVYSANWSLNELKWALKRLETFLSSKNNFPFFLSKLLSLQ